MLKFKKNYRYYTADDTNHCVYKYLA